MELLGSNICISRETLYCLSHNAQRKFVAYPSVLSQLEHLKKKAVLTNIRHKIVTASLKFNSVDKLESCVRCLQST